MSTRSRRWGAIGSAIALSLALGVGCGGDDDDASEGGGDSEASGQAADPGLGQRQLVIDHLSGVSQSYAAGDTEAASEHFGEVEAAWSEAAGTFPEAEASAIEGQIEALGGQLDSGAPAQAVVDAIEGLNTELAAGPDAAG